MLIWLSQRDGTNDCVRKDFATSAELAGHLAGLSTYARFFWFAHDFLSAKRAHGKRAMETQVRFTEVDIGGVPYIQTSFRWAAEFLSKKDYLDNWASEMNEEFAFWSFGEWKTAVRRAGFRILEDPNRSDHGSRTYTNPWIVENRYAGHAQLYTQNDGHLHKLPYPVTNVVLVAEKPDIIQIAQP